MRIVVLPLAMTLAGMMSLPAASAMPSFNTQDFYEVCKADLPLCTGYFKGYIDGLRAAKQGAKICVPAQTSIAEVSTAFQYHYTHEGGLKLFEPYAAVLSVLLQEYPCK